MSWMRTLFAISFVTGILEGMDVGENIKYDLASIDFLKVCFTEWRLWTMKQNYVRSPFYFQRICKKNDIRYIKLFLMLDVSLNDRDGYERTGLHWAVILNKPQLVALLLNSKARTDIHDEYGLSPLHWAVIKNRTEIMDVLLPYADVNALDNGRSTPLHFAASFNRSDFAEKFICKGASINAQDSYGMTPLHNAVSKESFSMVQLLLEKGAKIGIQDIYGRTPLHCATTKGYEDAIKILVALSFFFPQGIDNNKKIPGSLKNLCMSHILSNLDKVPKLDKLKNSLHGSLLTFFIDRVKLELQNDFLVNFSEDQDLHNLILFAHCNRFLSGLHTVLNMKDNKGKTVLNLADKVEAVDTTPFILRILRARSFEELDYRMQNMIIENVKKRLMLNSATRYQPDYYQLC